MLVLCASLSIMTQKSFFYYRFACAIELSDRVVVTGGFVISPIATVQVYNDAGAQEQLPDLQIARGYHACAYYLDSEDRAVSVTCNILV